jgi:hypothetical protein
MCTGRVGTIPFVSVFEWIRIPTENKAKRRYRMNSLIRDITSYTYDAGYPNERPSLTAFDYACIVGVLRGDTSGY